MYKLVRPNGYDFYSNTIDYAGNVGKIVRVDDYDPPGKGPCARGLHASRNPNDCFVGAKIPCRAFKVKGVEKLAGDRVKCRYKGLKILKEVHDLNKLFGWDYEQAANPINPFKIKPPRITSKHICWLRQIDSVRDSIGDSVGDSVRDPVWDPVWDSVWDSVRGSVRDSVWGSVWNSMWDSMWAYIGSFFQIKKWRYINHKPGVYPFQPHINLWKQGLVPSYDGKTWRLHGGEYGKVLWEGGQNG